MKAHEENLIAAARKLRVWMENHTDTESLRDMEWEYDYPEWPDLQEKCLAFLAAFEPKTVSASAVQTLLEVIAADHDCEFFAHKLADFPEKLLFVARHSLSQPLANAKWQLAVELGELHSHRAEAEELLLLFARDKDEYTSRRALGALAEIGSSQTEEIAKTAWATEHEYQRIMVLHALQKLNSPALEEYLRMAERDGREYLIYRVEKIRRGERD